MFRRSRPVERQRNAVTTLGFRFERSHSDEQCRAAKGMQEPTKLKYSGLTLDERQGSAIFYFYDYAVPTSLT